jgi:O-antigen/teichoic acid export membrane protein
MLEKKIFDSSLLSNSAVYFFSNLVAASVPFALLPILTRYLTPVEYGQVAIFQALLAGLGSIIGISAHGAASVKYYDENISKTELKYFIGNCFLILSGTTALILLGAFVFSSPLSSWLALETHWLLLTVITSSATYTISIRMGQWQIRQQPKKYGVFQVAQSLINILISLLLIVYFLQGAEGRIWVLFFVPLLFSIISLFLLYKEDLLGFAWRPGYISEILAFGVPLIPHTTGLFLLSSFDRFIINAKLGLAQVGIYMVAVQLVSVMGLVFDAINNAYVPWLFERLKRNMIEEKKQIVRWTYSYFIALLFVVVLAFLVGPSLLILMAGENYSEAANVIGWLALGQAFNGMYLMVTNYIFFSKRTGFLSLTTITAGLINIGLMLIFIPFIGIKGAAIAFSIAMFFKFLLTWLVAHLRHPMPWFDFRSP